MTLDEIRTPALVLERRVLTRNLERMNARMQALKVGLRPHLKTAKSARVAELAVGPGGPITVSTLAEARYFVERGYRDLTYAVGATPEKLTEVAALNRSGSRVRVVLDDPRVARQADAAGREHGVEIPALVEIDCGDGRGGLDPGAPELLESARTLHEAPGTALEGVLTHGGQSYEVTGEAAIVEIAEVERSAVTRAAGRLRRAGLPCPTVSAGSTPTATFARDLTGVTEFRPGTYMFQDLYQVGLGTCSLADVAVSVLATVVGWTSDGRALIDAGGLALSLDTGANRFDPGIGYGRVCDATGAPWAAAAVEKVNQEHGFVRGLPAGLEPGTRLRVLPNHCCMTAAMFDAYHVVEGSPDVLEVWDRARGW